MLQEVASTLLMELVQDVAGPAEADPLASALLTGGVALLLTPKRRPLGVALIAAGGVLLWRRLGRERAARSA